MQLNPDERLHIGLKYATGTKSPVQNKAKLKADATQDMQTLDANLERVQSYCGDPRCADAT